MQKWEYLLIQQFAEIIDTFDLIEEVEVAQKMRARKLYWNDNKDDERTASERLNELGKEGWELVSHSSGASTFLYILKRPVS